MIVLVCGGRDFANKSLLYTALDSVPFTITKIVNGAAKGADKLSTKWAKEKGIPFQEYPAEWNKYGRAAGPIRNSQMLQDEKIDFVIAFPGGTGTRDMIGKARSAGIQVLKVKVISKDTE